MENDRARSDAATLVEVRAWLEVEPGKPVLLAVIAASRAVSRVAELEAELEITVGALNGTREDLERMNIAHAATADREIVIDKHYQTAMARVAELDKVHAAACRHLVAEGPCYDTGDHDDESHDESFGCTYCDLNRAASAVDEKREWCRVPPVPTAQSHALCRAPDIGYNASQWSKCHTGNHGA